MTNQENVIHCHECDHCFKNKRSKTGYSCEVWGHDDFASDTTSSGYCHKAVLTKSLDLDDVYMFETKEKADEILVIIKQIAKWFGMVFRADVKDLYGMNTEWRDNRYGWLEADVKKIRVVQTERGYFIEFPQALPLR